MKPTHLLPPAVALLIVAAGMGYQRRGLDQLEAENMSLKNRAAANRAADDPEALFPKSDHSRKVKPGISEGKWDWVAVAELMDGEGNGNRDQRGWGDFQRRVNVMNEEELLAAIEEILALDVPAKTRQNLLNSFTGPLEKKNPELALRRLFGRLGGHQSLSAAWTNWLKEDVGAATAWFDEQIVAGKTEGKRLDGSDASRNPFEGELINMLFASDPAAAVKRLEALPAGLVEMVSRHFSIGQVDVSAQKTLADFFRRALPEKESKERLASGIRIWAEDDDFSSDAAYMERIAASPAEKSACVSFAIERWSHHASYRGNISIGRIEALRAWVDAQSPDLSGNLTGEVIGAMTQNNQQSKMSLEAVEEIVAHYQALEGGNEMLADALSRCVDGNHRTDYLAALVARLPDEQQRARILKKLENN